MNLSKELVEIIKKMQEKPTKAYDTKAEVVRVEDGVAWVHIPGGVDETPVQLTINASPGDQVQVRVANGSAFLMGNGTAPPTDDKKANLANAMADKARELAESAAAGVKGITNYFWHDADGVHVSTAPGDATSSGIKNVLVDSEGMEIRNGDEIIAHFYGDNIRLGPRVGHVDITPSSLIFTPTYGATNFKYQGIAGANITQIFTGDGTTTLFDIYRYEEGSLNVKINGTQTTAFSVAFPRGDSLGKLRFLSTPAEGDKIIIEYTTSAWLNPEFRFGINVQGGPDTVAEGRGNTASGIISHAEGRDTKASGPYSHSQNHGTMASSESQTAIGKYNVEDANNTYALIIGKGNATNRANAAAIDWNGNLHISGEIYTGCEDNSTGGVVYAVSRDSIAAASSKAFTVVTGKYYRVITASVPDALKGEYIVAVSSTGGVSSAPVRNATDLTITTSTNTLTITNGNENYAVAVRIEEI